MVNQWLDINLQFVNLGRMLLQGYSSSSDHLCKSLRWWWFKAFLVLKILFMISMTVNFQSISWPECFATLLAGERQVLQVGLNMPSKELSPWRRFTTSFACPYSINSLSQFLNFLVYFTHVWDWKFFNCCNLGTNWLFSVAFLCFICRW